jgi:putative endonuclease
MSRDRQSLGAEGERAAEKLLRRQRYKILERNYRCPGGEVDLVALDGTTVVFIEVKTRSSNALGNPFEAVDQRKQRSLVLAARFFVARHRLEGRQVRFDVVGVWRQGDEIACELRRDAFVAVW